MAQRMHMIGMSLNLFFRMAKNNKNLLFAVITGLLFLSILFLSALSHDKSLGHWVDQMRVNDKHVRIKAAEEVMKDPKAVEYLVTLLQKKPVSPNAKRIRDFTGGKLASKTFVKRGYAASALGELHSKAGSAVPLLIQVMQEPAPLWVQASRRNFVANRCRAALIKIRGDSLDTLRSQLKSAEHPEWKNAVEVTKELGEHGTELIPILLDHARNGSANIKRMAADALARIGTQADLVVPVLAGLLSDQGEDYWYLHALSSYQTKASPAWKPVMQLIESHPMPACRQKAAETLWVITPAEHIPETKRHLTAVLKKETFPEVKAAISMALKRLDDSE